jgi:hypothetical protein
MMLSATPASMPVMNQKVMMGGSACTTSPRRWWTARTENKMLRPTSATGPETEDGKAD